MHHEFQSPRQSTKIGSDRNFGFVIAAALLVVAFWPLLRGHDPRIWAGLAGVSLALVALVRPSLLHVFNLAWFAFGQLLHRIVSPVIMAAIFFGVVMPIGFVMRLLGKRPLRLKFEPNAASYWIDRAPPGPAADSMKQQF